MKTIDSPRTVVDPVITEVRRHKREIAAAFGFDVMALGRSSQTPKLEATERLEHWLLNASRSLDSILKDAAAADRKALSHQASSPLNHLELRN